MPISAEQWRLTVGRVNASRSLRPRVTGQPKMKLTSLDVFLFTLTALLGAILSGDGGRGTIERSEWWNFMQSQVVRYYQDSLAHTHWPILSHPLTLLTPSPPLPSPYTCLYPTSSNPHPPTIPSFAIPYPPSMLSNSPLNIRPYMNR